MQLKGILVNWIFYLTVRKSPNEIQRKFFKSHVSAGINVVSLYFWP